MRPFLVPLALVLALAAAAGPSAAAPTAGGTPITLTITVKSVTTSVKHTDRPPKGASRGDRFVFRDRLVNVARQFGKAKGAKVGGDSGSFTLTSKTTGTTSGVAVLPGGTIRFGGTIGASPAPLKVLGGSGRYAHARGILIVGSGASPLNIYRLSLPGGTQGVTV